MSLWPSNHSVPQTPDMASSVPVVGKGRKRKRDDGSNDAVIKHSDCESDSDSDFACEAPDGGDGLSIATGKRLQSGIRTFTYLKSSSEINLSFTTKEPSTDRVTQNTFGTNNTSLCSNSVPKVSVNESVSDSEGEEAAQVEEVEPTISCVKVTISSDTNRSITKPAPSPLKTDSSAIKVFYPLYPTRVMNTNNDLAHAENLGNESYFQQNSTTKYPAFHPLFTFTPQLPRHLNRKPPPPNQPPPLLPRPPPLFNFYRPLHSSVPPFRPFFPPYLNLPPLSPHPLFPPPPHLNHMPYPSLPPR